MQSPDEIFDLCDEQDRVIGQARRADVHANHWLHRAVHVWIIRSDNRLVVQRRSGSKDEYPHGLTSSASGHLDTGEDYLTAARRELGEELGLRDCVLEYATKLPASARTAYEHTVLYMGRTDADLFPHPGEVAGLELYTWAQLQVMLTAGDAVITPPFRQLLEWYLTRQNAD